MEEGKHLRSVIYSEQSVTDLGLVTAPVEVPASARYPDKYFPRDADIFSSCNHQLSRVFLHLYSSELAHRAMQFKQRTLLQASG